jgi:dTDP-4-dehydrorhamnose 3,5-epimerase
MTVHEVESRLKGVRYSRLTRYADTRGWLAEVWRSSTFGDLGMDRTGMPDARFVQANISVSAAGVLRGLHYHQRQLDHWTLVAGRAVVALVDVRPVLADPNARALVEVREFETGDAVSIPTGVGHGFLALEPISLLYLVTNEYDGSDELGFAWDDPALAIPWPKVEVTPDGAPILSDRDRSNPSLRELAESLRRR